MADYIFDAETFPGQDFDGGWHTLGSEATISTDANLVGGRVFYPTTDPANFVWSSWQVSGSTLLAQVDVDATFPSPVNADWNEFTSADFDTPGSVALDSAETFIVALSTNGDYRFNDAASYPIGNGIIEASNSRFHNGGAGPVFPAGTNTTDWFGADMLVEAASGDVAGAGRNVIAVVATAAGVKASGSVGRNMIGAIADLTGIKMTPSVARSIIPLSSRLTTSKSGLVIASASLGVMSLVSASRAVPAVQRSLAGLAGRSVALKVVAASGYCSIGALARMSQVGETVAASSVASVSPFATSVPSVAPFATSLSSVSGG